MVLVINACVKLERIDSLLVHFGAGKHYRVIDAIQISKSIGIPVSSVLPLFHSFTGCDTVSSFGGKGKKTAWSVWKTFPQLTDALKALTANPKAFQEREVMAAIERFVILLYDRTSL